MARRALGRCFRLSAHSHWRLPGDSRLRAKWNENLTRARTVNGSRDEGGQNARARAFKSLLTPSIFNWRMIFSQSVSFRSISDNRRNRVKRVRSFYEFIVRSFFFSRLRSRKDLANRFLGCREIEIKSDSRARREALLLLLRGEMAFLFWKNRYWWTIDGRWSCYFCGELMINAKLVYLAHVFEMLSHERFSERVEAIYYFCIIAASFFFLLRPRK